MSISMEDKDQSSQYNATETVQEVRPATNEDPLFSSLSDSSRSLSSEIDFKPASLSMSQEGMPEKPE